MRALHVWLTHVRERERERDRERERERERERYKDINIPEGGCL